MRDEHDRRSLRVQLAEDLHDLAAGSGVQRAGRLVRKQDARLCDHRAGDRHALTLAAGELVRVKVHTIFQPDARKRFRSTLTPFTARHVRIEKRQRDIVERRELRQKIEALENETDHLVSYIGEPVIRGRGYVLPGKHIGAGGRSIETADNIHKRCFAGPRGPHDGKIIPVVDLKRNVFEDVYNVLALGIILADAAHFQKHYATLPSAFAAASSAGTVSGTTASSAGASISAGSPKSDSSGASMGASPSEALPSETSVGGIGAAP